MERMNIAKRKDEDQSMKKLLYQLLGNVGFAHVSRCLASR
jgi:hypothetical protein